VRLNSDQRIFERIGVTSQIGGNRAANASALFSPSSKPQLDHSVSGSLSPTQTAVEKGGNSGYECLECLEEARIGCGSDGKEGRVQRKRGRAESALSYVHDRD